VIWNAELCAIDDIAMMIVLDMKNEEGGRYISATEIEATVAFSILNDKQKC